MQDPFLFHNHDQDLYRNMVFDMGLVMKLKWPMQMVIFPLKSIENKICVFNINICKCLA